MLKPATRLGPYEIVAPIGAGGMGEVYRARDTKLGRDVALKVLPEAFARDSERMARMRREAQVLASLNHPNIAAIYGFEDSGGTHALVMELVEGPTLAEKISGSLSEVAHTSADLKVAATKNKSDARRAGTSADLKVAATKGNRGGAIALDEALPIAKQIAEGLEYAHERGIVHRDLKPSNIKLASNDKIAQNDAVKILDFGLAKALESDAASMDISSSPTISRMATQAGIILGTAAYMSPEQAKGKSVDRRTDIWAFGCVLYEMLAGEMAFSGETTTDVLASILKSEPDWSELPANTPSRIRELLARCLKKDSRQRLQSIGDARIAIEEALTGGTAQYESAESGGVKPPLQSRWRALPWVLAGLVAGALIVGAALWKFAPGSTSQANMHFSAVTNFAGVQTDPALSPDGRSVAFVSNRDGNYNIYVTLIHGGNLVEVTRDANMKSRPMWSPDGATLAYAELNNSGLWDVWEVPALGGTPRRILLNAKDAAWSPDGRTVAYENGVDDSLWASGSQGENAHALLPAPGGTTRYTEPRFSPDGKEVAFVARTQGPSGQLGVLDVSSGKVRELTDNHVVVLSPAWSPHGRYIYFASSRGGTVNIWKISANGGDLEQITSGQGDDAELDVSADGKRIVFSTWRTNTNIAQMDLTAKPGQPNVKLLTTDPARNQVAPAYSHDGKHITYFSNLNGVENESIWISDADGSSPIQLVRDDRINVFPLWSPDDQRVVYQSFRGEVLTESEYRSASTAGGASQTVLKDSVGDLFDLGNDGRFLFLNAKGEAETFNPADNKAEILGAIPARLGDFPLRFSADRGSVAYIVTAKRDDDPNAGLWVTDFKSAPRQVFHGWVVWYARGPHNELLVLNGKPDLNGILWKVGWDGRNLERTSATVLITYSYWEDPSQNSQVYFDVSPDGRDLAFEKQTVLSANIGLIENIR